MRLEPVQLESPSSWDGLAEFARSGGTFRVIRRFFSVGLSSLPDSRAFGLETFWMSPAQCQEYRAAKRVGASVRKRMRRPGLEAR